ncbi:hypothetical protein, partial [Streptomyces specialis]|uniref:hypothetical protein n=1 Tax=Streptomyces specialis TaxID=498367 RepID=UPI000ABE4AE4
MSAEAAGDGGERLMLRPGVFRAVGADGVLRLARWPHAEALGRLGPGEAEALECLAERPCTARELSAVTGHDTGPLLARLRDGGWLDITVTDGDRALYTIRPLRSPPP